MGIRENDLVLFACYRPTKQVMEKVNRTLMETAQVNITVIVACGDDDSIDDFEDGREYVDFPSSSPYVLGCGGTTMLAKNCKIISEVVRSNSIPRRVSSTGGGISNYFIIPTWQSITGVMVSIL